MTQGVRTTVTLAALGLLLVLAGLWGWQAATEPLPAKVDSPICVTTPVAAGEKIFPEQVTVSVYNAGQRQGLAGRTMSQLSDAGFAEGQVGDITNARVTTVAIWADDPDNPAVKLVASRLGPDVEITRREGPGAGVDVIVGDGFEDVVRGNRSVVAGTDTSICSPPVE
ncbi:LytR C-terminal domain-containing protein [Nocardioides mangrovi]|uniref:LytR C-terminal domain-containing protein n=1 Tax=Nocardioides mangrovi TaxID=2874580 RepID=A0ABS7UE94_9ACTN|nr:LytR C-terminal domain-containing protein [Nocardioides mangrovi]MBZ5739026.1 LytR C-terminal domain-containing protein [Nocardioides mangrovi]